MEYPAQLHACLVVEFALDYRIERGEPTVVRILPGLPAAIWKLQQNLQLIRRQARAGTDEKGANRRASEAPVVSLEEFSGPVSYEAFLAG